MGDAASVGRQGRNSDRRRAGCTRRECGEVTMPLSKPKFIIGGAAVLGTLGIVAAVVQWWAVAIAVVIVLQVVGVAALVALRQMAGDLAKTRKSANRIERQLASAGARSSAVDEQIRADIADRLAELSELARAWDAGQVDAEKNTVRQR